MPTFEITSPDGRKFRVTGPDGSTQQDALAQVQAQYQPPQPDMYTRQAKEDSNTANLFAAIGGALKAPYVGAREAFGMAKPGEVEEWKKSMAGLWSEPMGKFGTVLGGAIPAVPLAMLPGGNTVAGAALIGGGLGAAQPVGDAGSRMLNTALGGAGGAGGKVAADFIGKQVGNYFAGKAADLATKQAANQVRDVTIADARTAGYVVPPVEVDPNSPCMINRVLQGISGKIQTAQAASIKNQPVTDRLAKQALSLPENLPITKENIAQVRNTAGQAYAELKKFGPIAADDEYRAAVANLGNEYRSLASEFPSQANSQIDSLLSDLTKTKFSSASAVEIVKNLRYHGFKNIKSQEPERAALGQIQVKAQEAIEDLVERNLAASGNADFLPVFRRARTLIAKAHTVEGALDESTGHVVAGKIKGPKLTGELATIGKFAAASPKSVQSVNSSMVGLSPLDWATGLISAGGAGLSGNPMIALAPLARPAIRSAILSKPYQGLLGPNYELGTLGRLAPGVADSEAIKALERLGITSGLLQIPQQ